MMPQYQVLLSFMVHTSMLCSRLHAPMQHKSHATR